MSLITSLQKRTSAAPPEPQKGFDVERERAQFPILNQLVNGKPLIYLDSAASSQKPRCVIDAIRDYYEKDHANVHRGIHALSERSTKAFEEARLKAQKFLGAGCLREVIFTKGATDGVNLVAHSFGKAFVHPGDEILIPESEHHVNIVPWQMLCQEKQADLRVIPITDAGELRLDVLERMLNPRVKLVALAHVSNALGTVHPARDVIRMAHAQGIPVLVDGAQGAPHFKIDVRHLDCDFYVFSGHKVYGPTGIGVLYGKAKYLELMPPYQTGGDMISHVSFGHTTWNELPYKFEAGTPNIADAVGLGFAFDYLEGLGRERVAEHEAKLLRQATERLQSIRGVRIIGTAKEKAGALSFVLDDSTLAAVDVGAKLDLEGIAIRTGHHCCQPLMARFGLAGTSRASFGLYNTIDEIETFAKVLETIVGQSRSRGVVPSLPMAAKEPSSVTYAPSQGDSPTAIADEIAEVFEFLDDWTDRYQAIIEWGAKLPTMPDALKTDANRVLGCQSTVFIDLRVKPDAPGVVEFLADSDAEIVRGLIGLLERIFSGQSAKAIVAFDVDGFLKRIGLDTNLSMGRRNGLAAMIVRIRSFAEKAQTGAGLETAGGKS